MIIRDLRNKAIAIYYYFNVGFQFVALLNFALLVLVASDKLKAVIPFGSGDIVLVVVPATFVFLTLFGYFMDRHVRFMERASIEKEARNPHLVETRQLVREMHEKIIGGRK